MKIATLLYGQQRTLKYTFPSIKRLFKDILNTDIYVIINENNDTHFINNLCDGGYSNNYDLMSTDEMDKLIIQLDPIVYKKYNINKYELKTYYESIQKINNLMNIINNNTYFSLTWTEYKKNNICEKILTIDECIHNGCNPKKINNNNFIIDFKNVEIYLRNLGFFYINMNRDKYSHIFCIRTDLFWYENLPNIKLENTISCEFTKKFILDYNKNIDKINYDKMVSSIHKIIEENKEDILTRYFYNGDLNIYLSIEQASLFRIENIIPTKYYDNINDIEHFLYKKMSLITNLYNKYPVLYPGWDGEYFQKIRHILYDNKISNNFTFGNNFILLRSIKN